MSHFARSSLIVSIFFGLDKIFGLGRAILQNRIFGLSYELDAFHAANNIPDMLSALISGGALGIALIPVLSEYLESKGKSETWDLFSRILNLAFIITGTIAIVIAILAPWLVSTFIVPHFPAEQQALTTQLLRLDLAAIMVFSISGLVMAGLQANQHFLFPALAPSLYNLGQIFGLLVLVPIYGVYGMVYGVILGAILHLGIQIPGLIRHQFRWTPAINLKHPGVRQVLILLGPRVATMFFIQLFFIVRDNLASGYEEGAVTALNNGWFIMQVPETMLGTAVAIALLPTISEIFSRGEKENFGKTINTAIRAILALSIPAVVLIGIGVGPLIQLVFNYSANETALVLLAARIYLLGMIGHALLEIAARSFYAQKNAITPFFAAALNSLGYLFFAFLLSSLIGFAGIAWANTIAFTTEAGILLWLLNRSYPGIMAIKDTVFRVLPITALIGIVFYVLINSALFGSFSLTISALLSAAIMGIGFIGILPFVWKDIKAVMTIGS